MPATSRREFHDACRVDLGSGAVRCRARRQRRASPPWAPNDKFDLVIKGGEVLDPEPEPAAASATSASASA